MSESLTRNYSNDQEEPIVENFRFQDKTLNELTTQFRSSELSHHGMQVLSNQTSQVLGNLHRKSHISSNQWMKSSQEKFHQK